MSGHALTFSARVISGAGRGKRIGIPTLNLELGDIPKDLEEGIYACFVTVGEMDNGQCLPAGQAGTMPACRTGRDNENEKRKTKNEKRFSAALHYGPRPAFKDSVTCEVHIIDAEITAEPAHITLEIVERLRSVEDFATVDALKRQIARDIDATRAILGSA